MSIMSTFSLIHENRFCRHLTSCPGNVDFYLINFLRKKSELTVHWQNQRNMNRQRSNQSNKIINKRDINIDDYQKLLTFNIVLLLA